MDTATLQKKYTRLFEKVRLMRALQVRVRKYHIGQEYEAMMRLQREVDKLISEEVEFKKKGLVEMF